MTNMSRPQSNYEHKKAWKHEVKPMRHVDPWDAAMVAAEDRRDAYLEDEAMNPIFEEILFEIPEDYVFPTRPMFTAKNYTVIAEMLRGVGDTFVSHFLAVLQCCAEEIGDEDERRGYLDDLLTRIGSLHGWMVTVQGFGDLFVHDNERFNWIAFKEAVKYDEVAAVRAQGINYYQGEK